jgi:hypothetical protein
LYASDWRRILLAGLAGGAALNAAMLATFRLLGFGWNGDGILIQSSLQSRKLVAVWTQLEPLPRVVAHPAPIIVGLILFSIGMAAIYAWLAPAWPLGVTSRALRLAGLRFFLTYLFWEFFTPFNLFGEPLLPIALEMSFWLLIALAEAFAIAAVMEAGR